MLSVARWMVMTLLLTASLPVGAEERLLSHADLRITDLLDFARTKTPQTKVVTAKGIGLGLVVCRNLVEANGGRIEVVSRVGEGTTFTVTMPAAGQEAANV